jgi:hypothetical protein
LGPYVTVTDPAEVDASHATYDVHPIDEPD